MNRMFNPTGFSSASPAVLRGGQSPLYWARDLSRRTEPLAIVRHACDWVEELAKVNLRICDQPLTGHSLAVLTEEGPSRPVTASAEPRREQRQFTEPEPLSKRNARNGAARATRSSRPETAFPLALPFQPHVSKMRRTAEHAQSNHQPSMAYELQPQADGSLLRRVAGFSADTFSHLETSREQIPAPQRSPHHSAPPIWNERMKRRDWRDLLAQRTAASLLRNWTGAPHAAGLQRRVGHDFSSATHDTSSVDLKQMVSLPLTERDLEQIVSLSITEQWLRPLCGTQAPANALAQLANMAQSQNGGTSREMKRTSEQPPITPRSLPHPEGFSGWPETQVNRNQDFVGSPLPASASRQLETYLPPERSARSMPEDDLRHEVAPNQTVATPFFPATDSWLPAEGRDNAGSSPAHILPPTLAPSLPPLRPPGRTETTPLPVAAATAQRGASQEEIVAQEKDLGLLAAQIKRIIDDEARRHGIDV